MTENIRAEMEHQRLLDDRERAEKDRHDAERRKLNENEAFAIGILQAVCAGAAFGIVGSLKTFNRIAGHVPVLIALTALVLGLVAAVAAAWFRHQYQLWAVKAAAKKGHEAEKHLENAVRDLGRMRNSMTGSAILLVVSLIFMIGALWFNYLVRVQ
jgi:hypothetical protein